MPCINQDKVSNFDWSLKLYVKEIELTNQSTLGKLNLCLLLFRMGLNLELFFAEFKYSSRIVCTIVVCFFAIYMVSSALICG